MYKKNFRKKLIVGFIPAVTLRNVLVANDILKKRVFDYARVQLQNKTETNIYALNRDRSLPLSLILDAFLVV